MHRRIGSRGLSGGLGRGWAAGWLLAGLAAPAAWGQGKRETVVLPEEAPAVEPVRPALPGEDELPRLGIEARPVPRATALREGTFLVRQRGAMRRTSSGWQVFVPLADGQGRVLPPMLLAPSPALAKMERVAGTDESGAAVFDVSGQVLAYHGRNVLLASEFALAQPDTTGGAEGASAPTPGQEPGGAPDDRALSQDPSVAELIRDLETAVGTPTGSSGAGPSSGAAPGGGEASGAGLPGFLSRRTGRLERGASGLWTFVFDTGTGGTRDPAITLLPCQTLARMEALAQRHGDSLKFELSGPVFGYHGAAYALPVMFQVTPPTDVEPRQ